MTATEIEVLRVINETRALINKRYGTSLEPLSQLLPGNQNGPFNDILLTNLLHGWVGQKSKHLGVGDCYFKIDVLYWKPIVKIVYDFRDAVARNEYPHLRRDQ